MWSTASGSARSAAEQPETANRGQFCLLSCCQDGVKSRFGLAAGVKDLTLDGSDRGSHLINGRRGVALDRSLQEGLIRVEGCLQRGDGRLSSGQNRGCLCRLRRCQIKQGGEPRYLVGNHGCRVRRSAGVSSRAELTLRKDCRRQQQAGG